MINVFIDEYTPCLKDAHTGELVQTEVMRIRRKSFLKKYSKRNGWYTNWDKLLDENEVYALVIEGTVDIQGLIAVAPENNMQAAYISWMCTNPQNNKLLTDDVKYYGVGGHLFAIAAKKSIDYTPIWCHDKVPEDLAISFTDCQQYAECKKRIDDIVYTFM